MFENQARVERYNISKDLFACKLADGYIETLTKLGC
jgi:hypothetical protein